MEKISKITWWYQSMSKKQKIQHLLMIKSLSNIEIKENVLDLIKWKWSCSVVSNSLGPHGHQVPPSMGFSRQEHWSGLPFPSPGNFPTQGSNPGLPHCRQMLYHLSHQGSQLRLSGLGKKIKSNCVLSIRNVLKKKKRNILYIQRNK